MNWLSIMFPLVPIAAPDQDSESLSLDHKASNFGLSRFDRAFGLSIRELEPLDEDERRHDELVSLNARSRFAYPSKESPSLRTCVNLPERTLSVNVSKTESLYSDILVVNGVTKKAATIAEIETPTTIDNESALQWKKYSEIPETSFYLFVPQTQLDHVKYIIDFFHLQMTGLRIYTYDNLGRAIITEDLNV